MNELMKKEFVEEEGTIYQLIKMIVQNTKLINDCIVYDKNEIIDESQIDYDRIKKMYGDRTGYEVACNEIRFEKEIINQSQITAFLVNLEIELSTRFSRKVAIYFQFIDEFIDLRFHSVRENETMWLSDDLNVYNVPIICYCS